MQIPLSEIAEAADGEVIGDGDLLIKGINSLDAAGSGEISFYADKRYRDQLKATGASAIIVKEPVDSFKGPQLVVKNPELAYAVVSGLFAPPIGRFPGISEDAFISETCRTGENVSIYPFAYIGKETVVGEGSVIFPGVFLGDRVRVGENCVIYPNVSILDRCIIGNNVIIHAGSTIGSDGFGFTRDGAASVKIPQTGIVQIDDDVEIGSNNSIDRAALGKTWIKRGVKTDNLVQIGHNVVIGENTIVVSQVGISGSVNVGREVVLGGQVGISDHVDIGDRAMIGSQSGVAKSIAPGDIVSGTPTMPHRLWLKTSGLITRLPKLNERLRQLEKKVKELEDSMK